MPPRTNPFQGLIAAIESEFAQEGFTVTQSAMLANFGSENPKHRKEVDIVVEGVRSGTSIRFLFECRDKKRAEHVQWIEELDGRSKGLEYTHMYAVSPSGFSELAYWRAEKCDRLTLVTVEEITQPTWAREQLIRYEAFIDRGSMKAKSGHIYVPGHDKVYRLDEAEGLFIVKLDNGALTSIKEVLRTKRKLITQMYDENTEALRLTPNPQLPDKFVTIKNVTVIDVDGMEHEKCVIEIQITREVKHVQAPLEMYKYKDHNLMIGRADFGDNQSFAFTLADEGQPDTFRAVTSGLEPTDSPGSVVWSKKKDKAKKPKRK